MHLITVMARGNKVSSLLTTSDRTQRSLTRRGARARGKIFDARKDHGMKLTFTFPRKYR
jgi:hypothetical protein